jgi:hypothetical protein
MEVERGLREQISSRIAAKGIRVPPVSTVPAAPAGP